MDATDPLADEFDALLRRSGLAVPLDRVPVLRRCYAEIRSWGEIIRRFELTPAQEPANVYDVRTLARGGSKDD